jgi:2-methylfumaryl-CoA isomerase
MYEILKGLRVVEGASFIAGPICCQHLLQLEAEVIRFDMIGGGPDFSRWPLAPSGRSFYWEGLNKGKKSIAINLASPEGRELAIRIATAPGDNGGLFVTNYPADGFLSHKKLAALRADMITVRIMGWADGRNGVDYTVNAATGIPFMTGPADLPEEQPVNHVLPAWDLIAGSYAAFSLLAAERHRRTTGEGGEVRLPLSDIAATSLGHLGQIAEAWVDGRDRPRMVNDLFGALGRDYVSADSKRLIIVAITGRQWIGLVEALELRESVAAFEAERGVSLAEEGARFRHRQHLFDIIQAAVSRFPMSELTIRLNKSGVTWNAYRKLSEALVDEPGFVWGNPVFAQKRHPTGCTYPTPGSAATFTALQRAEPLQAPRLGEHTDEVLSQVLNFSSQEIARLHDRGVVGGA